MENKTPQCAHLNSWRPEVFQNAKCLVLNLSYGARKTSLLFAGGRKQWVKAPKLVQRTFPFYQNQGS